MPVLTPRLAGLLAAVGLLLPFLGTAAGPAFLAALVVAVVAVVVDRLLCASPRTFDVVRELPEVVARASEATLTWQVTNPTRRRQRVALADELPPSWSCPRRRARLTIPVGATGSVARTIRPARRGRFELAGITLRVVGPLGLVARQQWLAVPGRLRVHPAFPSRDDVLLRIDRARSSELGVRATIGRGGGTDFETLRDYEIDDETRRVDWAATARVGRPIVRTYRIERNQQVMLVLDTGRTMAATVEGVTRLESALDAVLALSLTAARVGDKVGLLAHDDRLRASVAPTSRPERDAVILEAVYELEPRLVETDHAATVAALSSRFRRRGLVVVLTDLADGVTGPSLLPVLPLVARRHVVVVGAVTDPALVARAETTATDAEAVYRKAAAVKALEERARLAAGLAELGVDVVDAPPRQLAIQLVDRYLEAKARGRL